MPSRAAALAAVLAVAAVPWLAPAARADGDADDYRANCASCHTIGGGRLVGPDLKGVTDRVGKGGAPSRAWLVDFIVKPRDVLESGDPYAASLKDQARGAVMSPIAGMTAARAEKLLRTIEAESAKERSEFATTGVAELPRDSARLAALVEHGRGIFLGSTRPRNGGPACVGCHHAGDAAPLGGGRLAPDLSDAYSRLGGTKSLGAWLRGPPTPTMKPLFAGKGLVTDPKDERGDEILAVLAFLRDVETRRARPDRTGQSLTFVLVGMAVAAAALVGLDRAWGKRFRGVRGALVHGEESDARRQT
jgi:mono/diheme cytochrome c family protein